MLWRIVRLCSLAGLIAFAALGGLAVAAEVLPEAPPNHFNDFAGIVRPNTRAQLNAELAQFERDTSTQLVVAIYPRLPSNSSVEDYAVRLAQKWGVGRRDRKNGAVLFVFQESHDIRIVTGYGLEGALPDALCKQIIENEIAPRFRAGDFDGGLSAGVRAMMAAVRGEYRGSGRTNAERGEIIHGLNPGPVIILVVFALIFMSVFRARSRRNTLFGPRGRRTWIDNDPWNGGWTGGGGFGGGSWGSGSSGGSFSGGGGSFGGGGAGGKW